MPDDDFPCCAPTSYPEHDGALEAAFRAWNESETAPPLAYSDTDLELAFKAGASWAAGRGLAGLPVIVPVCDLCRMPAVLMDNGRYTHAEAADAAVCGLLRGGQPTPP